MTVEVWLSLGGVIVGILGYLLAKKDATQEEQIAKLWQKHDDDVNRLQDLELVVAGKHYERGELDGKFEKLESTIHNGLDMLGNKFDKLTDALIHNRAGQ